MRVLTVYSTTNQEKTEVNFSGSTFGDLKSQMGISSNNLVARGRETKTKYELNDSILNPQDQFIFISTKKQENGGVSKSDLKDVKDCIKEYIDDMFENLIDDAEGSSNCDTPECLDDELRQMEQRERNGN